MSTINTQSDTLAKTGKSVVNDFAFSVATKNGSGSQTSNGVLVKTLFNMGIPVNGKNLFPSNIKGLPTWYTIRASKDGYTGRSEITDIVVAYNLVTAANDIAALPPGGVCILREEWHWTQSRDDITYYEIPVKDLMKELDIDRAFRERVENMTYVGAVAQLFEIPLDEIWKALLENFGGKEKPAQMNMDAVKLSYDWTAKNIAKSDPFRFGPMDKTKGKIMITGNEAAGLGALFGGVSVVGWYPITPSTSIVDTIMQHRNLRIDPETGKSTVAVIQAEDELAAVGMIIGAGWAGARSLTATSGPGISLMTEFAGLAYYAEIPCVLWDVTRMGPSTGLPTRTSQGDLLSTHFLGHGDTRQLCLMPASPEEAFEFGWRALDIADQIQTPVFVLSDLDLGMNNWMSEPFEYPDTPIDHGKVLNAEQLQAFIDEHGKWGRYLDVDGDGVGYRTLPGTDHPQAGYLARGTGHDEMAAYSENIDIWIENMTRLRDKITKTALKVLPEPIEEYSEDKSIGIITFGTNEPAIIEARDILSQKGIETNYLRVRSLPMHPEVCDFIHKNDRIYVVENNFDGQLNQLLHLDSPRDISHVNAVALGNGLPVTATWIVNQITEMEGK
jgi:2-oxoglutarate/2-oxoacid ferredoxin oxidoreductase subunit alpha